MSDTKKKLISITLTGILILYAIAITNNLKDFHIAAAQKANGVGTFSASGYTGQSFILPPNYVQFPINHPASPPVGSIIAGNWSLVVNNGKLNDFKWTAESLTLNGKINGTLSITEISNPTGAVSPITINNNIQLSKSNSTVFKSIADININGRESFDNVPIVLTLLNGKLVNLSLDPVKTDGVFKVPLFGIVTSLTR